jgi:hypothetical protein
MTREVTIHFDDGAAYKRFMGRWSRAADTTASPPDRETVLYPDPTPCFEITSSPSFSRVRALPSKICSRSACDMLSASTA